MLFTVPEAPFLTLRRVACARADLNVPLSVDGKGPNPHSSLPVHPKSVGRRLPGPQGWGREVQGVLTGSWLPVWPQVTHPGPIL